MAADPMKPSVLVYAPNVKLGFRDLKSVDFFLRMEQRYKVHWVFSGYPPENVTEDIDTTSLSVCTVKPWRYRLWLYDHALTRFRFDQRLIDPNIDYPKTGYSAKARAALRLILQTRLDGLVCWLLRFAFRMTAPKLPFVHEHFDALLFLGSPKDAFLDDLLRAMSKNRVPSALIASNWDNATSKPFIELPNVMFTWGEQSAADVPKVHGIPAFAIGCPRFEVYNQQAPIDRPTAKRRLGLAADRKHILFAGAGMPFAEDKALEILAQACRDSAEDMAVLYRPHPKSWMKHSLDTVPASCRDIISVDPTLDLVGYDTSDLMPTLFAAVDGVCTPFSTIVVEAARAQLPSLCVAFDDKAHTDFDWVINVKNQPHLQCLHGGAWPLICLGLENFEAAAHALVAEVEAGRTIPEALHIFEHIVLSDERSYMDRLFTAVESHLLTDGGPAK